MQCLETAFVGCMSEPRVLELGPENLHIVLTVGEQLKDSHRGKVASSSVEGHVGVGKD